MAKRRRVSPATRRKISRGLKRYYRAQRALERIEARRTPAQQRAQRVRIARYHAKVREQKAAAKRRSLAAKRAAVTRAANRELKRIQRTKTVTPAVKPDLIHPSQVVQEWEVTVKYTVGKGKHHGEVVDVTLRLMGRPGAEFTNVQIRAAAWYAMKHGPESLTELSLEVIDWYNTRRSGTVEEYHYSGGDREAVLENARGLFHTVGLGGLRVALVE